MAKNVGNWFENAKEVLAKLSIISTAGNITTTGELSVTGNVALGETGPETITFASGGGIFVVDGTLPLVDPAVGGQLWSNSGVLTISAG